MKTSLESSLLQDIPTLNGNDSSQLEDWLTGIDVTQQICMHKVQALYVAHMRCVIMHFVSSLNDFCPRILSLFHV